MSPPKMSHRIIADSLAFHPKSFNVFLSNGVFWVAMEMVVRCLMSP